MKSFEILMNILNSILEILNKNGWFIRDPLNKDWYISEIYYDKENDELYFKAKEEVIPRWIAESDT